MGKQKQTIKDQLERGKEDKKRDGGKGNAHMERKKTEEKKKRQGKKNRTREKNEKTKS